ncbi:MAG: hypothetical protein LBB88_01420 [Planctomycetaceae bacterium]|nr:hypothetical protein [Planctomycetaceae bacterium]
MPCVSLFDQKLIDRDAMPCVSLFDQKLTDRDAKHCVSTVGLAFKNGYTFSEFFVTILEKFYFS